MESNGGPGNHVTTESFVDVPLYYVFSLDPLKWMTSVKPMALLPSAY